MADVSSPDDSEDTSATPRAGHKQLPTQASCGQQSENVIGPGVAHDLDSIAEFREGRCREYAAQLHPLADRDLPSALRGNPAYLLHYGFECARPRYQGDPSVTDVNARAAKILRAMREKIKRVNRAITGNPEADWTWPLQRALALADAARPGEIVVFALYSSDARSPPHYSDADIERIHGELRKEFETVEGPMWHWDDDRHGAEFQPFDKIYPCHPLAVSSQSLQKSV